MKHVRLAVVAATTAFAVATPSSAQTALGQTYSALVYGFVDAAIGDSDPAYGPFSKGGFAGPQFGAETALGGSWSASALSDDIGGGRVQARVDLSAFKPGMQTFASRLTAEATLQYVFKIDGSDQDPLIPVLLLGSGGVSLSKGGSIGQAGLEFYHDGLTDRYRQELTYGQSGPQFVVNQTYNLQPGHIYSLTMYADVQAFASNADPDTGIAAANASVDPTFTILGGYGSRYHFVGLPSSAIGTDGTAAVPEPGTWAIMVSGFGMIGSAMRRGRRQVRILPG